MQTGRAVTYEELEDVTTQAEVFNGCVESLDRMHDKKWCHTDIRVANMVTIAGKYTLVDFGDQAI